MSKKDIIIAIDGPSGVGKSTVSKKVAERLGLIYIDTGAMYRSVALSLKNSSVSPSDLVNVESHLLSLTIEFKRNNHANLVFLNGLDVSTEIRTKEISELSSKVSSIASVREYARRLQQEMGESGGVVMEGRDIGTVIFPDAEVKIFLTASNEVRAKRRLGDYKDGNATLDEVMKELSERDKRDEDRELAPLRKAKDAIEIDTGDMTIEEVVEKIIEIADNIRN